MKTNPTRANRPPLRFVSGALGLVPTARLPVWRGSPVTFEVAGPVAKAELRAAALRLIVREAASMRWDFRIEDRVAVVPSTLRRAA
ncbi:MAG: hypothetical protein HYU42_00680 [Candidatus Rokubacteria bacterium]|nr:hypothetical protein [Candidatus Rokubacteria bacterium]MBI3105771.1 hypothetical protein [Candidatus Rokubacteria bacterium]